MAFSESEQSLASGPPHLLAGPAPGPLVGDERVVAAGAGGWAQLDEVLDAKPLARSSRIQSPWPRWNSTVGSSGHSKRCMPNCGRSRRSVAGMPSWSGTHIISRALLPRNTSSPPGRSRRAASGIRRYGSAHTAAPYSLMTRSKAPSRNGTCSPVARRSGKLSSNSSWNSRAIRSCPGVGSTPTARAPRRASQADTYAVPQPISTVWAPSRCRGRRAASDSGTSNMPQVGSAAVHCRCPVSGRMRAVRSCRRVGQTYGGVERPFGTPGGDPRPVPPPFVPTGTLPTWGTGALGLGERSRS